MPFTNVALLDLGTPELLLIFGIIVLLFGGKKLPELSRSLGKSIKELKEGVSEGSRSTVKSAEQPQRNFDS